MHNGVLQLNVLQILKLSHVLLKVAAVERLFSCFLLSILTVLLCLGFEWFGWDIWLGDSQAFVRRFPIPALLPFEDLLRTFLEKSVQILLLDVLNVHDFLEDALDQTAIIAHLHAGYGLFFLRFFYILFKQHRRIVNRTS